jgi:hypothetical protein
LGENQHTDRLAKPVGEHDHIADELVGMARVDTQAKMNFYGRVEVLCSDLFGQAHSFFGSVGAVPIDFRCGCLVSFSMFSHHNLLRGSSGRDAPSH